MKTVCVIGTGRMGSLIVRHVVKTGEYRVVATDVDPKKRLLAKSYGAEVFEKNRDAVRSSDAIILAVKPKEVEAVLNDVKDLIGGKLVISIAAAVPLKHMEKIVADARFIRVMPNILIEVGEAFIAICPGSRATEEDVELASRVFSRMGEVARVEENLMDAVTGFSGSGPAYVFTIIDAFADAGVKIGLPKELALRMAARMMLGSAKMVLEGKGRPMELRDMVATPGGTTIMGIYELEKGGVRPTIMNAVEAAFKRARELSEPLSQTD
ncbi:MAG: pyrroline-5-carboxylate reductase [Candidatus Brockarchaeota archaeon]|nr:pyrroline-5-carboxylate reductase [Candidatus Brockarchaeota archaeon]